MWPIRVVSFTSLSEAMCCRGITSTCVGAWGLMSRKATQCPFSATIAAGISFLTIRQNKQSVLIAYLGLELRRSNDGCGCDDGGLEPQGRGTERDRLPPVPERIVDFVRLEATLRSDRECDRARLRTANDRTAFALENQAGRGTDRTPSIGSGYLRVNLRKPR